MFRYTRTELFEDRLGVLLPADGASPESWHVFDPDNADVGTTVSVWAKDDAAREIVAEITDVIEPAEPSGPSRRISAFRLHVLYDPRPRQNPDTDAVWLIASLSVRGIPIALKPHNAAEVERALWAFRMAVRDAREGRRPTVRADDDLHRLPDAEPADPGGPEPSRRTRRRGDPGFRM